MHSHQGLICSCMPGNTHATQQLVCNLILQAATPLLSSYTHPFKLQIINTAGCYTAWCPNGKATLLLVQHRFSLFDVLNDHHQASAYCQHPRLASHRLLHGALQTGYRTARPCAGPCVLYSPRDLNQGLAPLIKTQQARNPCGIPVLTQPCRSAGHTLLQKQRQISGNSPDSSNQLPAPLFHALIAPALSLPAHTLSAEAAPSRWALQVPPATAGHQPVRPATQVIPSHQELHGTPTGGLQRGTAYTKSGHE
jgi:hypothetical protein